MAQLDNKHVLLGVTGSIAAYKACELVRLLRREGCEVRVVLTESARQFVSPLTFETLSDNETIHELFPKDRTVKTRHISLSEWADCVLICPATANIIGKMASGLADDFLTTAVLAARSTVIVAPAMDHGMSSHPVYLDNCRKLRKFGFRFVEPETGELASGAVGKGRLAALPRILDRVRQALLGSRSLSGKKVMVTAGPTREYLDPVRYLSNRSSGKMGYALAAEARMRGAEVILISGPSLCAAAEGVAVRLVESAHEMAEAVRAGWLEQDILVMAAAVSDFRPKERHSGKLKKDRAGFSLELVVNEDILAWAAREKAHRLVVGFALETDEGEKNATLKLDRKKLDLICLNQAASASPAAGRGVSGRIHPSSSSLIEDSPLFSEGRFNPAEAADSGMESDMNQITLIDRRHRIDALPRMPKWEASRRIWDKIEQLMAEDGGRA
ncbi:bifunctional phosphopantothenoylcysteine decarboxylase/phosphopantothenate--cysteine ligase CoaBC [bacterium]|nr:bifunctional phosphopantothenoylcysteine decarboxylase/phosphopantothenate--cysteine ligase CoaBC [bacterium]